MNNYLEKTRMLDYGNKAVQELIQGRGWASMDTFNKIREIYNFVRDEIKFGYNTDDDIPASKVLADGYGQCNTKGTLFMAILRAVGVPCRMHGFTINKELQFGAMTGIIYRLAPKSIIHSWVEILYEGKWFNLEGFILDQKYLSRLQKKFDNCQGSFCGYGVAVEDFKNPHIEWNGNDTYIQKEGINNDFGVFDNPDRFFLEHSQQLSLIKKVIFRYVGRQLMNRNVEKIRNF